MRKGRRRSSLPLSQFLQHMLALLFSLPDSRGRLIAASVPGSLIMNHHRHLPLFIVVRFHLIYRHDSRAYYSCFLSRRLRTYYSAARFHFVFYRRRLVRKPMKSTLLHCIEFKSCEMRFGLQSQAMKDCSHIPHE